MYQNTLFILQIDDCDPYNTVPGVYLSLSKVDSNNENWRFKLSNLRKKTTCNKVCEIQNRKAVSSAVLNQTMFGNGVHAILNAMK